MKTCFKCKQAKPLVEFYRHAAMADGHLGKCKTCTKLDVSSRRAENVEAVRQYDRERASLPHRAAQRARIVKDYELAHPERKAATTAVGNAVRDGRLQRWPCEICGKKAHAHHPHYGAPLLVTWLCPPHHKEAHALTKD
jgi:ribosome-binding protein aMBF1 (putative translation factor)